MDFFADISTPSSCTYFTDNLPENYQQRLQSREIYLGSSLFYLGASNHAN